MGRDVINGQCRDAITVLDGLELSDQPLAVRQWHFFVAAGTRIPAAVQRFCGDHVDLAFQAWRNLEPPVHDQLDAREAFVQRFNHANQAVLLCSLIKAAGQAVRVHGVQKEPPVAPLPQGRYHLVRKKSGPLRGRLVDHHRVPVPVAGHLPLRRDVLEIGPRGLHFCHRRVGVKLGPFGAQG